MNQIVIYRNIFLERASAVIDRSIVIFSRTTGLSYEASQVLLLVIICYLAGIIILIKIHRRFLKKKISAQKECTFEYDNILYLIAQEEYKNQSEKTHSPIRELFDAKHKNYLQNHDLILNAIRALEAETKHILFTPEMEKKIITLRKKIHFYNRIEKIFGIIISLATAGIYLLFR